MSGFFITGTDTNVGKTIVSAAVTLALQGCYWKPIQSGIQDEVADMFKVMSLTGLSDEHFFPSCYALQGSFSPDYAATLEEIEIDIKVCQKPQTSKPLIIEGAGGVLVPINDKACMIDLIKQYNLPVIIVSRGTLGSINHTLLTIEALKSRNINIHGIVFSGELLQSNKTTIENWGRVKTLFHIPHFANVEKELGSWVEHCRTELREKCAL